MESAQRGLLSVLLKEVCTLGLISKTTYLGAADLVHSSIDFPNFFRYPVCMSLTGGTAHEYRKDPQ